MEKEKYIDDLRDIKDMMSRSSRFISLSGMSGIVAGSLALTAAYLAYELVFKHLTNLGEVNYAISPDQVATLLLIACTTLVVACGTAYLFTRTKAKKDNQKLWNEQSKRLFINMMIPLSAGGVACLILISHGFIGLAAPFTLLFYGLALVNASKYTLDEVRSLGMMQIGLGLAGTYFVEYGLLFWAIGFGVLHIIYGVVMYKKYGA